MKGRSASADYALEHVGNVLGFAVETDEIGADLLETVFREISRSTEIDTPTRDAWGNWDFSYGRSNLAGELYVPWLDRRILEVRDRLLVRRPDRLVEPYWPEDRPFAVCLSHDVDFITLNASLRGSARSILRDARLLLGAGGDGAGRAAAARSVVRHGYLLATARWSRPRPERTYDEWLRVEERHGFRSTFFYFPERVSAPHPYDCSYSYDDPIVFDGRRTRVRTIMKEMADAGWDVGLHGSFHSAVRPGMLGEQKRQIEETVGRQLTGTRQHWLHYDVRITPVLQAEAGFLADSTQGFNRNVGFRAGTAFPYACWDLVAGTRLSVTEIPQHVMDGSLFTPNALEYDTDLAIRHCLQLMDEVEAVHGCLTLNWHPNGIQYPAYWAVYEAVLSEAARRRAWGASMEQVRRWWQDRAARIAAQAAPRV